MAYGTFNSIEEVAEKFDIKVIKRGSFLHTKKLNVPPASFAMVSEALQDDTNYVSEQAICETIISPLLKTIAKNYRLKVWSHVPYNVDVKKGLVGVPDYLIAPQTKYGGMAKPSLCVIEAKKENFDEGWAQALAEMVASSILGTNVCYGIVSTGEIWSIKK